MAKLRGEWQEEKSKAMMVSSYIDAAVSRELDFFKEQNPEIFTKQGELKADYKVAEDVISQMQTDEMFMKYISGTSQVIMTGEIAGVPVKIKIDSYHEGKAIVDLKSMANLVLIWNEKTHQKENFIDYYDYILQRCVISRNCETKYWKAITIYNCSCNETKIFTEGSIANTSRKARFKT